SGSRRTLLPRPSPAIGQSISIPIIAITRPLKELLLRLHHLLKLCQFHFPQASLKPPVMPLIPRKSRSTQLTPGPTLLQPSQPLVVGGEINAGIRKADFPGTS